MIGTLLILGYLWYQSGGMVDKIRNGNSRRERKRGGFPRLARPPSGRAFFNGWDLKSNRATVNNKANLLFWEQENRISPNADNMVNQGGGKEFLSNYRAMLNKDFHRTPKELNPDQFQRYPMSSLHAVRSRRRGQFGQASSRQNVVGDGVGFSHFRTSGPWNPHSQASVTPSSYNRTGMDLSILRENMITGRNQDDMGSGVFGKRTKLF